MKTKLFFLIVILGFFFFSFTFVSSESVIDYGELFVGKNFIVFNESNNSGDYLNNVDVKTLIKYNPNIEAVTFNYSDYKGEVFHKAFVNIFGGIGDNFFLDYDKDYEIISNKNISLFIPS